MKYVVLLMIAIVFSSCAKVNFNSQRDDQVSAPVVTPPAPTPEPEPVPKAFQCEVYDLGTWFGTYGQKLPDFDTLSPVGTVETDDLNDFNNNYLDGFDYVKAKYPGLSENYGLSCRMKFKSVLNGTTRFYLTSDDGAKLFVNGVLVINDDSLHAPRTVTGDVVLGIGDYELRVDYYQGPRTQVALALEYSNSSVPKQLVK